MNALSIDQFIIIIIIVVVVIAIAIAIPMITYEKNEYEADSSPWQTTSTSCVSREGSRDSYRGKNLNGKTDSGGTD